MHLNVSIALHTVSLTTETLTVNNQVETSIRGFLVYALPKFSLSCCLSNNNPISETAMSDPVGPDVLSNGQLGLVFGVEYTLLAIHDLYRNPVSIHDQVSASTFSDFTHHAISHLGQQKWLCCENFMRLVASPCLEELVLPQILNQV